MSAPADRFLAEHVELSRRFILSLGSAGVAALAAAPLRADAAAAAARDPQLQTAIDALEPWLTPVDQFRDVSRGTPVPSS